MSPVAYTVIFKKKHKKSRAGHLGVLKKMLNNWELRTVILFLNKQEIDICKSSVHFGLFFGKPNEKTKAEWVGFLQLEYIWMRKCDKMQTIFSSFKIEQNKHSGVHCRSEGCCQAVCPSVRIDCSNIAASIDQLYQPSMDHTKISLFSLQQITNIVQHH